MSTAIEFEHVSKQYRLGLVGTGTLSHDLNRWWQTRVQGREDPYLTIGHRPADGYVWALQDIDFKVEAGEVLGIVGPNGAGKSTLLKLLSRVTAPTTGLIRTRGRIGTLLEVGTGFHGEMTGRENIYMNGAILGMKKREIDRKLDEIVDFSGCGRYLDTPVKRYSSGMIVRLGFAVAAHLDTEILVVDEVLAVGDAEFQRKAIGKMQEVTGGQGRTVLFVSHQMDSIRKLCRQGLVLREGRVDFLGSAREAVDHYIGSTFRASQRVWFDTLDQAPGNDKIRIRGFEVAAVPHPAAVSAAPGSAASASEAPVLEALGRITTDDDIQVTLQCCLLESCGRVDAAFELRTMDETVVFHRGCPLPEASAAGKSAPGEYRIRFVLPRHWLNAGQYRFRILFGLNGNLVLWKEFSHMFQVEYSQADLSELVVQRRMGLLRPELDFHTERVAENQSPENDV